MKNSDKPEKLLVASIDKFGICSRCGSNMMLTKGKFEAYVVSEYGWIKKQLLEEIQYTYVCPRCGYRIPMELTNCGLYPKSFRMHPEDGRKAILANEEWRKIGYVEEE